MKTLQQALGLAVIGTLLIGTQLEAQQQPAPIAPEPGEAVPPAAQPSQADDAGALQAPPQQPAVTPPEDSLDQPPQRPADPADNPFAQPPATQPPAGQPSQIQPQPQVDQPPYSPQPAAQSSSVITPPEDPFLPPHGMVTPPECLIDLLGFYGHHPFVYSDSNCFDLASAAYRYGYYEDAIALLSHAIDQYPQAHYYYLRGMSQMKAGLAHDAIVSADGVLDAEAAGDYGGLDRVRERFNGPLAVQFRQLLQLRQAAR